MVGTPRGEAGCDGRRGFQWLLIERPRRPARLAKSFRSDRTELAIRGCLLSHQPAQGFQASLQIDRRLGGQAGQDQGLRQARIVVGKALFEPDPIFALNRSEDRHQSVRQLQFGGVLAGPAEVTQPDRSAAANRGVGEPVQHRFDGRVQTAVPGRARLALPPHGWAILSACLPARRRRPMSRAMSQC